MKNKTLVLFKTFSITSCLAIALGFFSGCTYSINMVHTSGTASDIVDEEQKPTADLNAEIPLISE